MMKPNMVYFFTTGIHTHLLCLFHNFLFLSSTLENDTSTVPNVDYENFFENDSYTIIDQNQSQWNTTVNITVENITEIINPVNEGVDDLPYWQWRDSYLSYTTPDEDICICDLLLNVCDINCCCDLDCSKDDMKVFSRCDFQVSYVDENYCYLVEQILRNNTLYQIQKNPDNGLLCIVHNNLKQYLRYKDLPLLKSHQDLDVLLNYQSKLIYSWDTKLKESKSKEQDMKFGSSIFISISQMEAAWSLPHSCFARMCTCQKQVLYLEDFNSSCILTVKNLKNECENNKALFGNNYVNFCLSSQKGISNNLFTHSKVSNSNNELYSDVDAFCLKKETEKPTYSKESNTCYNVVNYIHFTIYHNGYLGIQEIEPTIRYENISSDNSSATVTQYFSVEFKWYNTTKTNKRSGNPGYQVGLPIITGANSSQSEKELFQIEIQPGGLSVFAKDSFSRCQGRKSIKFGKNFKTSCYFEANNVDCRVTQEQIYNILLGPGGNDLFVGIFGNANDSNREDWIEAYHEEYDFPNDDRICHLMTGLKVNVGYAAVGTVQNPQFKIMGLGYHHINFKDVDISKSELLKNIILSMSVSFFDVTQPVVPHYPDTPSLKVNLPADFFYPFLKDSER